MRFLAYLLKVVVLGICCQDFILGHERSGSMPAEIIMFAFHKIHEEVASDKPFDWIEVTILMNLECRCRVL